MFARGAAVLLLAAALTTAACGGSEPPSPAPSPADVRLRELLAAGPANDGRIIRFRATLIVTGTTAEVCEGVLKSYPPQCMGGLRVVGEIPADVIERLTAAEGPPGSPDVRWGEVVVSGVFHAERGPVAPFIEPVVILIAGS